MVDEEDRPFALGTDLHPGLERLPAPGFDPEAKRAGPVDLRNEEMHQCAAVVDPDPGPSEGSIPVGDREGYIPDAGFGQHYQPQSLREIPVLVVSGGGLTNEQQKQLDDFGQRLIAKGSLNEGQLIGSIENALKRIGS